MRDMRKTKKALAIALSLAMIMPACPALAEEGQTASDAPEAIAVAEQADEQQAADETVDPQAGEAQASGVVACADESDEAQASGVDANADEALEAQGTDEAAQQETEISTWAELDQFLSDTDGAAEGCLRKNLKAGKNDSQLVVPEGRTVRLDLCGHTIDRACKEDGANGGVLANAGDLTIVNGTIMGGFSANNGGGILNSGTLTLEGVVVTQNAAYGSGGGIANSGTLNCDEGVQIRNNYASTSGGGIANSGSATLSEGATIECNSVRVDGGGVSNQGDLTLDGATVKGNRAVGKGGGVFNCDATLNLYGTTSFSDNRAAVGGAVYAERGHLGVGDSVKATGNTADNKGGDLFLAKSTKLAVDHEFTDDARLHVTLGGGSGILTSGYAKHNEGTDPKGIFQTDKGLDMRLTRDGEVAVGMPDSEEGQEEAQPEFAQARIIPGGKIGIQFVVGVPAGYENEDSCMHFEVGGKSARECDVREYDDLGDGMRGYFFELSSIEMAEPVKATLHCGDCEAEQECAFEDCIKAYFDNNEQDLGYISGNGLGLGNSGNNGQGFDNFNNYEQSFNNFNNFDQSLDMSSVSEADLVRATANYGHYTQLWLSGRNGWKLGDDYRAMDTCYANFNQQAVAGSEDMPGIEAGTEGAAFSKGVEGSSVEKITCSLRLDTTVGMDFRITPKKGAGELTATAECDGREYHAEKQGDGSYLVHVDGFLPGDLGRAITLTGDCDGEFSLSASPLAYVGAAWRNSKASDQEKDALLAIYNLYQYAQANK